MDRETLEAYERAAEGYASEWHDQPVPADLYAALGEHFTPGATADVGCGAGRDTAWLAAQGFPVIGYDASAALLAEAAARRHPGLEFACASLPELAEIGEQRFRNVLCETVIMHLDPAVIPTAVARLVTLLEPSGTLYLSWRVTEGAPRRDDAGRLYASFPSALVTDALAPAVVVVEREEESASSGRVVHRVIARAPQR